MGKKIISITVLSLIIVGLIIFIISPGNGEAQSLFEQIRIERNSLVISNRIVEAELSKSLRESAQLKEDYILLESENTKLGNLLDDLSAGSEKISGYITEYGAINREFAEFIRQNSPEE